MREDMRYICRKGVRLVNRLMWQRGSYCKMREMMVQIEREQYMTGTIQYTAEMKE